MQSTPRAKRPPRCRSQQAREARNSSPPFYVVRWPAIFPGTFKVDSSEMSPCALNSGGGAPGCFPAASTPMAGNNMRQRDQGALRNAQEGVVYPLVLIIWFVGPMAKDTGYGYPGTTVYPGTDTERGCDEVVSQQRSGGVFVVGRWEGISVLIFMTQPGPGASPV